VAPPPLPPFSLTSFYKNQKGMMRLVGLA
jgi:hypothetical protein